MAIVGEKFCSLWAFFVALCHALQEKVHELTATDAFWLGLIDEVIGQPDLPCRRQLTETLADTPETLEPEAPPEVPTPSKSTNLAHYPLAVLLYVTANFPLRDEVG